MGGEECNRVGVEVVSFIDVAVSYGGDIGEMQWGVAA